MGGDLSKIIQGQNGAQNIASVKVTKWGQAAEDGVRRDCFWNAAKEQAEQIAKKEGKEATSADTEKIMNEIIEYNNQLAGDETTIDTETVIHEGESIYLPLKYAMDEVADCVGEALADFDENDADSIDALKSYGEQLYALLESTDDADLKSQLEDLIGQIGEKYPDAIKQEDEQSSEQGVETSNDNDLMPEIGEAESGLEVLDETQDNLDANNVEIGSEYVSGAIETSYSLASSYGYSGEIGGIKNSDGSSTNLTYEDMDALITEMNSQEYSGALVNDANIIYARALTNAESDLEFDNAISDRTLGFFREAYEKLSEYKNSINNLSQDEAVGYATRQGLFGEMASYTDENGKAVSVTYGQMDKLMQEISTKEEYAQCQEKYEELLNYVSVGLDISSKFASFYQEILEVKNNTVDSDSGEDESKTDEQELAGEVVTITNSDGSTQSLTYEDFDKLASEMSSEKYSGEYIDNVNITYQRALDNAQEDLKFNETISENTQELFKEAYQQYSEYKNSIDNLADDEVAGYATKQGFFGEMGIYTDENGKDISVTFGQMDKLMQEISDKEGYDGCQEKYENIINLVKTGNDISSSFKYFYQDVLDVKNDTKKDAEVESKDDSEVESKEDSEVESKEDSGVESKEDDSKVESQDDTEPGNDDKDESESSPATSGESAVQMVRSEVLNLGADDPQGDSFENFLKEKYSIKNTGDMSNSDMLKYAKEYQEAVAQKNYFLELYDFCAGNDLLKGSLKNKVSINQGGSVSVEKFYAFASTTGIFKTKGESGNFDYNEDYSTGINEAISIMTSVLEGEELSGSKMTQEYQAIKDKYINSDGSFKSDNIELEKNSVRWDNIDVKTNENTKQYWENLVASLEKGNNATNAFDKIRTATSLKPEEKVKILQEAYNLNDEVAAAVGEYIAPELKSKNTFFYTNVLNSMLSSGDYTLDDALQAADIMRSLTDKSNNTLDNVNADIASRPENKDTLLAIYNKAETKEDIQKIIDAGFATPAEVAKLIQDGYKFGTETEKLSSLLNTLYSTNNIPEQEEFGLSEVQISDAKTKTKYDSAKTKDKIANILYQTYEAAEGERISEKQAMYLLQDLCGGDMNKLMKDYFRKASDANQEKYLKTLMNLYGKDFNALSNDTVSDT